MPNQIGPFGAGFYPDDFDSEIKNPTILGDADHPKRKERYCLPWNAGLASSPGAVERRLGKLLDALADQINPNIVSGQIETEVMEFRYSLIRKLEADGYQITVPKNNYRVRRIR